MFMDNRDTLLTAQLGSTLKSVPFLELDLRDVSTRVLLGRRGQLQFLAKLVFKAGEEYREEPSVFRLWADVRVDTPGASPRELGRAEVPVPVFFKPPSPEDFAPVHYDPWTRVIDRLTLDVDHRLLDEIEQRRNGGPVTFTFAVGGIVQHGDSTDLLNASNHQISYEIAASDWTRLLMQLEYGTYMTVEIPLTGTNGLTGDVGKAARTLQEAIEAFRRGAYDEAVADCRPGMEALEAADKGRYSLKPWDRDAGKAERFYWVQRALLSVTHVAHHPNDPAFNGTVEGSIGRADAEAAIAILAALLRRRTTWA